MAIEIEFKARGLLSLIKLLGYTACSAEEHLDRVEAEAMLRIAVSKMFELLCTEEQIKEQGTCAALIEAKTKVTELAGSHWRRMIQDLWIEDKLSEHDLKTVANGKYAVYVRALHDFRSRKEGG